MSTRSRPSIRKSTRHSGSSYVKPDPDVHTPTVNLTKLTTGTQASMFSPYAHRVHALLPDGTTNTLPSGHSTLTATAKEPLKPSPTTEHLHQPALLDRIDRLVRHAKDVIESPDMMDDYLPVLHSLWKKVCGQVEDPAFISGDELEPFRRALELAQSRYDHAWSEKLTTPPFDRLGSDAPLFQSLPAPPAPVVPVPGQSSNTGISVDARNGDPLRFPVVVSIPNQSEASSPSKTNEDNVDAAGRIPSVDPSWAIAPTVPFPAHPEHSFRYETIQRHCGLPDYAKKDRKYAHLKREVVEALHTSLANGILMIYDPPCPGCVKRGPSFMGASCVGLTASPKGRCFNCTILHGRGCVPDDSAAGVIDLTDDQSVATRKTAHSNKSPVALQRRSEQMSGALSSDGPSHVGTSSRPRHGTQQSVPRKAHVEIPLQRERATTSSPNQTASSSSSSHLARRYHDQLGFLRAKIDLVARELIHITEEVDMISGTLQEKNQDDTADRNWSLNGDGGRRKYIDVGEDDDDDDEPEKPSTVRKRRRRM